jgi:hypothetical protein
MATRNIFTSEEHASTTVSGIDTDGSGDVTITVGSLRQIEHPGDVDVQAYGGYTANVRSVSGNQVTVRIFQSAGSAAEHAPVASGTDVTNVHVGAVGT